MTPSINYKDLPNKGLVRDFSNLDIYQKVIITADFFTNVDLMSMQIKHIKSVATVKGFDIVEEVDKIKASITLFFIPKKT
jgi:hypothetical protein